MRAHAPTQISAAASAKAMLVVFSDVSSSSCILWAGSLVSSKVFSACISLVPA